jgi:hypothetical protein
MDTEGPLWFRGLATGDETALADHVRDVLLRHDVDRIVVGHSIVPRITARFGGKVIVIDVALNRQYNSGQLSCLVIEKGRPFVLERGGQRVELPAGK